MITLFLMISSLPGLTRCLKSSVMTNQFRSFAIKQKPDGDVGTGILSGRDTFFHFSRQALASTEKCLVERNCCRRCFLLQKFCICDRIASLFNQSSQCSRVNLKLDVFMHYKEWGRASNTGKLLSIGMPSTARTIIYGDESQQNAFMSSMQLSNLAILYPGPTSISISEFARHHPSFLNDSDSVLCVLDATWSQSHAMNRALPTNIPRVRIDEMVVRPSLFLSRKQSATKTKVSTIEAVLYALHALGENDNSLRPLWNSLEISVDAVAQQSGKKPFYGHVIDSSSVTP
jgi:DTW domain-containing protein YfiP